MTNTLPITTDLEEAILREALEQLEHRYRNAAKFGADITTANQCKAYAITAHALLLRLCDSQRQTTGGTSCTTEPADRPEDA